MKRLIILVLSCLTFVCPKAQQIKGIIVADDGPLPGASVRIDSLKKGTSTDLDGIFSFQTGVEGKYQLSISYIGYETKKIDVVIKSGLNELGTIKLAEDHGLLSEVVVTGVMAPSQAKAYSMKSSSIAIIDIVAADAVGKLPDRNAAEAVQRIQGVAVARYHGEADQATVRGTPFAWTSTLFNGSRLPSSNVMGNRSSVLDAVPSELIQYVQVAKALTPDWEGDAIGGSVNFITRTAPLSRKLNISAAGGYNDFSQNGTYNASLVYGDRFFNDKLGVIVAGAIWDRQWGSDSYDVKYNTGLTKYNAAHPEYNDDAGYDQRNSINTVMFKRYMGKRQTMGLNAGLEYKANGQNKVYFRGLFDKFNDIRPVYESYIDYNNNRYQYNYRYSYYQTQLFGGEIGAEHQLSPTVTLDWSGSDYVSKYFLETPPTSSTKGLPIATFHQKITSGFNNLSSDGRRYWGFDSPNGVGGDPLLFDAGVNDPSEVMDPEKLMLQQLVITQLDTREEDRSFQANLKIESSDKIKWKFGGKYRSKYRENTYGSNIVYLPAGGSSLNQPNSPALVALSQLQREGFPKGHGYFKEMDNNYDQYILDPLTKQQLFDLYSPSFLQNNGFVNATSASNATNLYDGTENVIAAYAMVDIELMPQLRLIGGVRNEYTYTTLNGTKATVTGTKANAVTTLSPVEVKNNYNALLPMVHLKYSINQKSNLRAAYTRTFVRPNFGDMTPGESVNSTSTPIVITKGNSDLRPTFANNFDLMGEYFFDNIGLISGGVFYKDIKDVIFSDVSYYTEDGNSYMLTQSKNLESASLFGFEAGINKRFDFFPGFWSGFGAEVNYTYIHSEVEVPRLVGTETVVDKSNLPDQSKNLANIILFYEKGGVMVRLAGNYRGASIYSINQQLGPDFYIWTDKNFTIDASATVSIAKNIKVFVELNNLTDEPLRQYMGDSHRITNSEWYGIRGQAGIRWDIIK